MMLSTDTISFRGSAKTNNNQLKTATSATNYQQQQQQQRRRNLTALTLKRSVVSRHLFTTSTQNQLFNFQYFSPLKEQANEEKKKSTSKTCRRRRQGRSHLGSDYLTPGTPKRGLFAYVYTIEGCVALDGRAKQIGCIILLPPSLTTVTRSTPPPPHRPRSTSLTSGVFGTITPSGISNCTLKAGASAALPPSRGYVCRATALESSVSARNTQP